MEYWIEGKKYWSVDDFNAEVTRRKNADLLESFRVNADILRVLQAFTQAGFDEIIVRNSRTGEQKKYPEPS